MNLNFNVLKTVESFNLKLISRGLSQMYSLFFGIFFELYQDQRRQNLHSLIMEHYQTVQ